MGTEIERRFVVTAVDPDIFRAPSKYIEQAYFDTPPHYELRIRIVDGKRAVTTFKEGVGMSRLEDEEELSLAAARLQFRRLTDKLGKRRYMRDGWEADVYDGTLTGLVIAEFENDDAASLVVPAWIKECVEVTESLSNRHLARLASDLATLNLDRPVRDYLPRRLPRIVCTGAPCSGKTTLMREIAAEFGDEVAVVPEAATIVITQVGIKPTGMDYRGMQQFQRAVYRAQVGFEEISEAQAIAAGKKALILDRGTLDGAAYLNGGQEEFERVCRTIVGFEHRRYNRVIRLAPPPPDVFAREKTNNPGRSERSYAEIEVISGRTEDAWAGHPDHNVADGASWPEKSEAAKRLIREFLASVK